MRLRLTYSSGGCGTSRSGTSRSSTCGFYEQLIIDGKKQALFGEGVCNSEFILTLFTETLAKK